MAATFDAWCWWWRDTSNHKVKSQIKNDLLQNRKKK
jgi:hypothetical protein